MLVTFECRCGNKAVVREVIDDCGCKAARVECPSCNRWGFWHERGWDCPARRVPSEGGNCEEIIVIARMAMSQGPTGSYYLGQDDLGFEWAKERGTQWLREVEKRWRKEVSLGIIK
jgi:hypothetical protein